MMTITVIKAVFHRKTCCESAAGNPHADKLAHAYHSRTCIKQESNVLFDSRVNLWICNAKPNMRSSLQLTRLLVQTSGIFSYHWPFQPWIIQKKKIPNFTLCETLWRNCYLWISTSAHCAHVYQVEGIPCRSSSKPGLENRRCARRDLSTI